MSFALVLLAVALGATAWRFRAPHARSLAAEQANEARIAELEEERAAQALLNEELRRTKEAAVAANDAKTRYLAGVSHEIRSPLNTIYGYAQLLERDESLSGAEAGGIIRRSAEHLANLVEGLLEISRIEGGVIKVRTDAVDIRRLLNQIVEMFRMQATSKGLDLTLSIATNLPECVGTDERKLRQILINLVSNAVKYTRTGSVTIKVKYRSQVADIEVIDTGFGIAAEDLERVFEPFDRGTLPDAQQQPGIGLGLAITRVLTNVLGGDLGVTSTLGEGSRFRLRVMLPARAPLVSDGRQDERITGYHGRRRTILVVDDDPAQRGVLLSLLNSVGFEVQGASDGAEAIDAASRHRPDLALLDIQLPGMSGWEIAASLREAHGDDLKVVMASANAHEFRSGGDGEASHDAFVTKPIDLNELLSLVGVKLGLRWEKAQQQATAALPAPSGKLPDEATPYVDKLRQLLLVGHVRGLEVALTELEDEVPAAARLVAMLRYQLNDLDLQSFLKILDDAQPS